MQRRRRLKGVPVVGYQTDTLPAFYTRSSGYPVDYRVETPEEIAQALHVKWDLGLAGGLVVGNPIPAEHALDDDEIEGIIAEAISEMTRSGITGKDSTPFLLARIAERTGGRSLDANIQLVLNNARLAAAIAAQVTQT
jgi:pseudouridine-5'-phosphate glycosidase